MSIISRDDLAGTIAVGMEGAADSYDQLEELSGWVSAIDTENLQLSQGNDGSIIISPTDEPAEDGEPVEDGIHGDDARYDPQSERGV